MQELTQEEIREIVKLRKVAFQNLNIVLTHRLNEELDKNLEFAKLFISKEFLKEIFNLNEKIIAQIATKYNLNIKSIPSVFLHKRHNSSILALGEEREYLEEEYKTIRTEEKIQKRKELEKIAISEHLNLQLELPIDKKIMKRSFTEEEMEQIKLQSITSTDTKERIKALRTAMYLPIPNKDKVYILTRAIAEDDSKVKLESLGFLKYFGIRPHIVEIFKEFTSVKDSEKKLALDTLLTLTDKLETFEKIILVILLLSFLKFESNPKFINMGFELAQKVVDKLVANVEWAITLIRIIIEKLSENFYIYSDGSYRLLKKILENANPQIEEIVFTELDTIPAKNIRGLFLETLSNVKNIFEGRNKQLATKIFYELKDWDETRFECRKLGNCFSKFGFVALNTLIKNFDTISLNQRQFFIRLITPILRSITPSEEINNFLNKRFSPFIKNLILKSNKQEFITLLEENIILNLPVNNELKIKLASLILLRTNEFLSERITDLVLIMFSKLDVSVLEILYKNYVDNFDTNIKKIILKILRSTYDRYDYQKDNNTVNKFIKVLKGDYGLYNDLKEEILMGLCALHGIKNIDIDKIVEFSSFLKSELPKSKMPWVVIDGFSYIVSSPQVPLNIIVDIANILISILQSPMPDIKMDQAQDKGGTRYKIYGSIRIFTDLIPATISGLEKIALNNKVSNTLRRSIFDNLMKKYVSLSDFKDIWGPNSITTLIRAIKNIAISKDFPSTYRIEVLKNFAKSPMTSMVCETVCEILDCMEVDTSVEYYVEYYINKVLDELLKLKDTGDYETIYYIAKFLLKLLRKKTLVLDSKKNQYLKEKILIVLVKLYNENVSGIYGILLEILKIEHLPSHLSKLIKAKLKM